MDQLRLPFFLLAILLVLLVVGAEVGGGLSISGGMAGNVCNQLPADAEIDPDDCNPDEINQLKDEPPGLGIAYLGLLDGVWLFSLSLMAAPLLITTAVQGRIQGCATFIFALILLVATIGAIFLALAKLLVMVTLLLAMPFGTIAYFAIYAAFPRAASSGVLGLLMLLKLGAIASLIVAQQRFLQNNSLVFLMLTSLIGNILISFLHGFVPIFLVSITDALAAIIVGVLAVIWLLILLIGSIPAIGKAFQR